MSDKEKVKTDHQYALPKLDYTLKNIDFDHSYQKKPPQKNLRDEEEDFFFNNMENFPEYDTSIIKSRYVQTMALNGACCDISYEFKDDVIEKMGDYDVDLKLLSQIYLQEFTTQLTHSHIFKVNPHIHAIFTNSLFDPEKGLWDPETRTYKPNIENKEYEVERHIWLKAFQVDENTELPQLIESMISEFCNRIETTQDGPSGLIYSCYKSSTLAYSLNFFEYAGCDPYGELPNFVTRRKAITPIIAPNNDCFTQCIRHHFNNVLHDNYININFERIRSPTNFRDISQFEEDNPSIAINVLTFEYHMDTDKLSHFEPKYRSRNEEATYEIILFYHNHHFSYVHNIGRLLGKIDAKGKFRSQHWCFSCLGCYDKLDRYQVTMEVDIFNT